MNKQVLIGFFFCCFAVLQGHAQEKGIKIIKDPKVDAILSFYADHVNSIEEAPGYRIQILAGTSRDKAYGAEGNFKYRYPSVSTYLTYNSPYFKVRVGNFTDRLAAYRFLQNIKTHYPGAFMVEEMVKVR